MHFAREIRIRIVGTELTHFITVRQVSGFFHRIINRRIAMLEFQLAGNLSFRRIRGKIDRTIIREGFPNRQRIYVIGIIYPLETLVKTRIMQTVIQIVHCLLCRHMTTERTAVRNVAQHTRLVFIPRQPIKVLFITVPVKHRLGCELHGKHDFGISLVADIPQGREVFLKSKNTTVDHLLGIV